MKNFPISKRIVQTINFSLLCFYFICYKDVFLCNFTCSKCFQLFLPNTHITNKRYIFQLLATSSQLALPNTPKIYMACIETAPHRIIKNDLISYYIYINKLEIIFFGFCKTRNRTASKVSVFAKLKTAPSVFISVSVYAVFSVCGSVFAGPALHRPCHPSCTAISSINIPPPPLSPNQLLHRYIIG